MIGPLDFLTRYVVSQNRIIAAEPGPEPGPWGKLYFLDRFRDQYRPLSPVAKVDPDDGQPVQIVHRKLPPLYIAQVIVATHQGRLPNAGTTQFPGKLAAAGYVDPYQVLRRTTAGPNGRLVSDRVQLVP